MGKEQSYQQRIEECQKRVQGTWDQIKILIQQDPYNYQLPLYKKIYEALTEVLNENNGEQLDKDRMNFYLNTLEQDLCDDIGEWNHNQEGYLEYYNREYQNKIKLSKKIGPECTLSQMQIERIQKIILHTQQLQKKYLRQVQNQRHKIYQRRKIGDNHVKAILSQKLKTISEQITKITKPDFILNINSKKYQKQIANVVEDLNYTKNDIKRWITSNE